ncbi:MAG: hypothetical protein JJT89_03250 [Nitriliruptoraceae bacterium]|nr:hypothetical protein [Nitriliruptoraceae bacterium]
MTDAGLPSFAAYRDGTRSFVPGLRPQDALAMPLGDVLDLLRVRHGAAVDVALSNDAVDLDADLAELPPAVRSPVADRPDSSWLARTNMVGINLRTVGDLGNVVKYGLTLPGAFDAVQLLPFWESGVVKSLYGMASWHLDPAFFSEELYEQAPGLDSIGRQLRAVSNLLHVTGRTVGLDVVPHTDRFSEQVLANPALFEWMHIREHRIVDHTDAVLEQAVHAIATWLGERGPALAGETLPADADELFALDEAARLRLMFGDPGDAHGRTERRIDLVKYVKWFGLEPVPATMAPPFRGIEIDPDPDKMVIDEHGMQWPDIVISEPQFMSRVFSPMARYKLYERVDENRDWVVDFDRPRQETWDYICEHYARTRHIGNFDFMRGDMAHVQMCPDGVPADQVDEHYDIHRAVKRHIQRVHDAPWFASFAEAFLHARDVFQYGEELDHLEAAEADVVLGDLQSTVVGDEEYLPRFRRYLDDLVTRRAVPAYTVMTADKDDPRFDAFYRAGNEARMMTALLLPDMPSYVGLGFEIRDVHHEPAPNEHYTKPFVFEETGDSNVFPSKARFSDTYVWGTNDALFARLTAIRTVAEDLLAEFGDEARTRWLLPPDATGLRGLVAWTQVPESLPVGARPHLCVVNYDLEANSGYLGIPALPAAATLVPIFSTLGSDALDPTPVGHNGYVHRLEDVAPGEGRIYVIETRS